MAISKKIINSFYLQDELNPDVWDLPNERYMGDEDAQNYKLKPLIRERLLKVAEIFIEYLDTDLFIQDVIFVGSLVGLAASPVKCSPIILVIGILK